MTPEQVARIVALIAEGKVNDKLARRGVSISLSPAKVRPTK